MLPPQAPRLIHRTGSRLIDNRRTELQPLPRPLPGNDGWTDEDEVSDTLWMIQREVQRNAASHRDAHEIALLDAESIEDRKQIFAWSYGAGAWISD